jgi:phosphate transport system permease protein
VTVDTPRKLVLRRDPVDRTFRGVARGGGIAVLTIMLLVGVFLAFRASQALSSDGVKFLTVQDWDPDSG